MTQKSATGRHSPKDKGTQKKNFFGDALGCIYARELIRSAIERASERSIERWLGQRRDGGRDGGGRPRVDKVPRDKTGHLSGDMGFDWHCVSWGRDQGFYWPCLPRQA